MSSFEKPADFRSDTVTRPCAAMRRAMAEAEVGDDVFDDDPTVHRLQDRAAEFFGAEAALFVPTGTMGNQVGLKVLTQPGQEVLMEENCHIFLYEVGAAALISGVQTRPIPGSFGVPDLGRLESSIRNPDVHHPVTSLILLENTHNVSGGSVVPKEVFQSVRALADLHSLKVYLDGARLINAVVASREHPSVFTAAADLTSTCLSKGLGCPAGSVLLGRRDDIAEARRVRKALGGGLRQAGILAAAGLYALENLVDRIEEDHVRARRLAEGLADAPGCHVDLEHVQTNIVLVDRPALDAEAYAQVLHQQGVWVTCFSERTVRFVTHRDVDDSDVERAIQVARRSPAEARGT